MPYLRRSGVTFGDRIVKNLCVELCLPATGGLDRPPPNAAGLCHKNGSSLQPGASRGLRQAAQSTPKSPHHQVRPLPDRAFDIESGTRIDEQSNNIKMP